MNKAVILSIKLLRKLYFKIFRKENLSGRNWKMFSSKNYANDLIYNYLLDDKPRMVARFGSTEMLTLVNYLGVKRRNRNYWDYISGKSLLWFWDPSTLRQINLLSGFFPPTIDKIEKFCDLMLNDISQIDILASWLIEEKNFEKSLIGSKKIVLEDMEPFFCDRPWTKALEHKKVLVVHPFAETIEHQYSKRTLIFNDNLLPHFHLKVIKAIQTVAGEKVQYSDWFEALESMKTQIDNVDYDVCIIGCGAYGLPLAAHVKRMGKKSIHMGGATQLLFGIKGKRWEQFLVWPYSNLFNEYWVRPGENEKPKNASAVEGACYW